MYSKLPYFEDHPHIPIKLKHKTKKTRFLPLLDTGADFSVFYKTDAIRIGLDWEGGKKIQLENADGSSFEVKQFELEVDIEGFTFPARICFAENNNSDIPLLGRADIFKHFRITVDEREKQVEMQSHN